MKNRYSRLELNQNIFSYYERLHGKHNRSMASELRKESDNFINLTRPQKGDDFAKEKLKVKPFSKFLVLPPDYKLGIKKPIEPIKSNEDNSLLFHGNGRSLYVPKSTYNRVARIYTNDDDLLKKLNCIETHTLNQVIKRIESRLKPAPLNRKILSERKIIKSTKIAMSPIASVSPSRFDFNNKYGILFEEESARLSKSPKLVHISAKMLNRSESPMFRDKLDEFDSLVM